MYYHKVWKLQKQASHPLDSVETIVKQEPLVRSVIAVLQKRYQSNFLKRALVALGNAVVNIHKDESPD